MKVEKGESKITHGDVLVVDDDITFCELLKKWCETTNLFRKVLIANDYSRASTLLRNQKFSLILLDHNLPKKSGHELVKEINDNPANYATNVCYMSAQLERDTLVKVIESGVKHFLVKPFDEPAFRSKVDKIILQK